MLTICTWFWGDKYPQDDVGKLERAVRRHLKQPFRFLVMSDRHVEGQESRLIEEADRHLLAIPGCFARMRMFDLAWQEAAGFREGDRIANVDLDSVIVDGLDPVFDREEPFCILQGINGTNPCPYNGSVWMLRAGYRPDVWSDFSLEAYKKNNVPFHAIPDDQGWFNYKIPKAGAWGPAEGVYGFQKRGWPGTGDRLPPNARIVSFPGWRSPSKFLHVKWIRENWK